MSGNIRHWDIVSTNRSTSELGETGAKHVYSNGDGSCALAKHGDLEKMVIDYRENHTKYSDLRCITAKRADICLDPLQRSKLILEAEIQDTFVVRLLALGEAEWSKAVIKADLQKRAPVSLISTQKTIDSRR